MEDAPWFIVAMCLPLFGLIFVAVLFYTALMELGELAFSFLD
jgi:hypothetical protein